MAEPFEGLVVRFQGDPTIRGSSFPTVSLKGFDGEDWPPGGVVVLLDGVMLGGGPYTYYTGSYSFKDGIFKAELVLNQHNFPPPSHVFFNAKNVGIGVSGTYEDDQAELTGIALV